MEFRRELCIDIMPELRESNVEIKELKGGITNRLYQVSTEDGGNYVFRFYGERTDLFISRDVEMENLRLLGHLEVTQKLIKYLPERGVTIVEFIPGYVLTNQDFLKEEFWEKILLPVKTIHESSIRLPYHFDPMVEVSRLFKILEGINPNYPEFDIQETIQLLEQLNESTAMDGLQYVPCHNDLLADNFILTKDGGRRKERICLIDWEYGGMAPTYYDIADMFQEILAPREVEKGILSVYWNNKDLDYQQFKTDLFKPFPDIYWFLWSLIQLNISKIQFDYYEYGRRKYQNARENIRYLRDHYGLKISSSLT